MNTVSARSNIVALFSIQAGNSIIPLVVFPYLLLRLGGERFSLVVVSEAIALIGVTIALYGFDITGVRRIIHAGQNDVRSQFDVWLDVLTARGLVLIGLAAVGWIGIEWIAYLKPQSSLIFIWMLYPLGVVLQSGFFFQARKDNVPLAIAVVLSRTLSCIFVIFFVKEEGDAVLAVSIVAGGYFLSGVVCAVYVVLKYGSIPRPGLLKRACMLLRSDWDVFVAGLSVMLYRGANTLVLGFVSAPAAQISVYALAEKYIKMLQAIVYPISQHELPGAVGELINSRLSPLVVLWKRTRRQIVFVLAVSALYCPAILIYQSLFSSDVSGDLLPLLILMLPAAAFGAANFMFGPAGMVALGMSKEYLLIVFMVGCTALASCMAMSALWGGVGAAIVYVMAEVVLCAALVVRLRHALGGRGAYE